MPMKIIHNNGKDGLLASGYDGMSGKEKGVNPCPVRAGCSQTCTSNRKSPAGAPLSRDGGQASAKSGGTACPT